MTIMPSFEMIIGKIPPVYLAVYLATLLGSHTWRLLTPRF
jgi:hypothetical protein